jgi:GGDEF domain-containing protein
VTGITRENNPEFSTCIVCFRQQSRATHYFRTDAGMYRSGLDFCRTMHRTPEGLLARLGPQLTRLEKRDWELWAIVSVTGILVSLGLAALILPAAFLKDDNIHFEITVSRPLAIGLIVLLALLNTYLVARRLDIRRLREELISTTLRQLLIEQQSFTDPLTEIYSRRSLDDIAGRLISHAKRLGNPLTFLMVDVDHFKQVNTKFGHLTGDTVLAEFASLLKASVRGSDAVVRYGGDEFLIFAGGYHSHRIGESRRSDQPAPGRMEYGEPSGRFAIECEYRDCRVARRRDPGRGARRCRSEMYRHKTLLPALAPSTSAGA